MIRIHIAGFEHVVVGQRNALAEMPLAGAVRDVLRTQTLYEYASGIPNALVLHGRAPVYVIEFAGVRVAVRHAMRGGVIARLATDRFLPPTRGLRELLTSLRLRVAGVSTPVVAAVVTYPAGGPFRRADVMTRFIEGGIDLATVFADARNDVQRRPILDAVVALLRQLTLADAVHPDLNLKNVVITADDGGYRAHLLDVDRVYFHASAPSLVTRVNTLRLVKSLRKWRARADVRPDAVPDADLRHLTLATGVTPR